MADNEFIVWDLEGNRYSMTRANARDMVSNMGWTLYPPTVVMAKKAAEEALEAEKKAIEEENIAKAFAEAKASAEENVRKITAAAEEAALRAAASATTREITEQVANDATDPAKMNLEQLQNLAQSLGIVVDQRWGKSRVLNEIKKSII